MHHRGVDSCRALKFYTGHDYVVHQMCVILVLEGSAVATCSIKQTTIGLIVEDSDSPTHYNNNSRLFFRAVADSQDHWNLICNMQSTTTIGFIINFGFFKF